MKKKYKDLIDCANAITDEEIEDTDWLMPSDIDPFLNALFKCIYKYRHPEHEERVVTREDAENIALQLIGTFKGRKKH